MEKIRERENWDWWLLFVAFLLLFLGVAVVLDTSSARALHSESMGNDPLYFFKRQAMWAVVASVVLILAMNIPYWFMRKFWLIGVVVSIVLLVAVELFAKEINGSKRWLSFGPVSFQPSELAKISLVLFLARYSEICRGHITEMRGFMPAIAVVFLIGGFVAKEDLGTSLAIFGTGLGMIFMMGARPRHIFALLGMMVAGAVLAIMIEPFRMERIKAWVAILTRPVHVHDGPAYQPAQGLIALGSGGVWGKGLTQGGAKHLYLPAEHTDYIFATIGEETGLFGCLLLLLLFATLIIRGLTVAHRTTDWFGCLLAAGLTCTIGVQTLVNIGVVSGVLPCTGVPLPFISYGGTSLVFTALAVGIILNVSQYPARRGSTARTKHQRESSPDGWGHRRPHLSRS